MRVLTRRELNRTTLARQLLLEKASLNISAALEKLVGLQAQLANSPFIALWTRLAGFQRSGLAQLIEKRQVVKATLMRATLHLVTAEDFLWQRPTLQPALTGAAKSIVTQREEKPLDVANLLALAKEYLAQEPRSFAELSQMLAAALPTYDIGALRYTVRTHLPLVQVPTDTLWSYPGNPKFTLAETWLDKPIPVLEHLKTLILRYLGAFGPASVADLQAWSGLGKLKEAVEALRLELATYRDEEGRELFDLPDMPLPSEDTPAPVRFLPDFDNTLLGHHHLKRTRIIANEYREKVYTKNLGVKATILVDGFVSGSWKTEKKKGVGILTIEPFAPLSPASRDALAQEGEQLLRFMENEAKSYAVQFTT